MSDDDGDAKFLIKNFVMPAIDKLDKKMEQIITCQIDLKLQDEILKAKIASVELQVLHLVEALEEHKKDMQTHYNPYYNETIPQKIWRKKYEITAGGGAGAFLLWLLQFIMENYNG